MRLMLVTAYVVSIGIVQVSRYFKRFYVRRFANNVNRHMKQILYGTLVRKSRLELEAEGTGNVLTKAILDVDDCVEGMRKFTTEIFDTGVALLSYACMLLWYDWRLALLCMIFPPISYVIAEKMKVPLTSLPHPRPNPSTQTSFQPDGDAVSPGSTEIVSPWRYFSVRSSSAFKFM